VQQLQRLAGPMGSLVAVKEAAPLSLRAGCVSTAWLNPVYVSPSYAAAVADAQFMFASPASAAPVTLGAPPPTPLGLPLEFVLVCFFYAGFC
jgi:hypothetical protein